MTIKIDFNEEILFGRDQLFNSYPVVFPTVTFRLTPLEASGW